MSSKPSQNLLSTYEAAKASGYSPAYISSLCRSGELPSTRNGKAWMIKRSDLKAYLSKVEDEKKRQAEELARKRKDEYWEVQRREQNLLSTYEAAKASGYSPAYISSLCRSGELPSTRNGKAWVIKADDLQVHLSKVEEEKKKLHEELAEKRKNEYREVQPVVTVTRKVFAQRFTYNPVHTYTRATAALLITFIVVSASTGVFTSKEESIADVREAQGSISEMNALSAAASNSSSPMVEVAKSIAYFTYATIDNFFADTERKVAAFFAPRTNVQVHVVDTPDPVSISSATTSAPLNSTTTIVQGTTTIQNITQNITRYITNATDNRTTVNGVSAEFLTYALSGFGEYLLRPVWLSFYALDERFANVYDRIDDIDVDGGGGTIGGDITGDSITISGNGSIGGSFSSGTTTVNGGITVNGDANITGELTVGTFNVATLNVTSTISAPSFNATSTTATSTFAGPLQFATATGNSLSVNTLFATSSTFANLLATNATTTNATSTNLFATLFRATTGTIDTFTSTLATITNAVVTTLSATNATLTNATTTNATSTNLSVSGIFRLSGITPSRLLFADSSGAATSTDLSTWVTGTANQISVADNGAGGVTLSLPSDLQLGNATATSFSSNSAAFGSTGTTTISTAGALTTPSLSIGSLNGILRATGGAIATSLVSLATDVEDVLPVSNGGTGTGTAPVFGQLLVGNGTGGYALMATSSLGITSAEWGNITGTLSDQTDLQNALDAKLSLSAWFATTTDALAEGTNLYYTDARVSTLLDTYSKDYFFSTTSANYWETQQTARTADDLTNNSIEDLSDVASMTPNVNDFLTWNGSAWTNVATSSFGFVTGVAWGDITGTLSDQTDLQNALNAKFSLSDWHATTTHTGITSLPSLTTLGTITSGVWQGSAIAPAYLDPMVLLTTEVDTSAELAGILSDEVGTGSVVFSNAPTFTGVSNFADIITTNATSTNFFVSGQARFGTLDGLLRADAGVISVATPGVDYLADATGDWTGTFDGYEGSYYLANSFSTSSANSWLATRSTDDLAEGSNLYYTDARVLSYVDSLGKGYFFSTTSANTWLGTKSTDDIAEGANLYYTLNRFASALAGTTTDALLEGSTNLYYTDARARAALSSSAAGLSYNSATGVLSLSAGYTIPLAASTTEWATAYSWGNHATQNYFDLDLNDSDDIPEGGTNLFYSNSRVATYLDTVSKGYFFSTTSANYWDTQQTARTADDLTNNSIEDLMDVAAMTKSWGNLLSWNGSAWTNVATSSLGLTPTFTATYPLQYSSNVLSLAFGTTTANTWGPLQTFNSGILAQASSTIVGDFTITGTTHLEEVSIAGDIIPTADNVYSLGTPSRMWRDVYIGPGSLYINGQKVLEEDATTDIVVTADPTQNLKIKTTDGGNIELNANATGQLIFKSNLNITGGKSIVTSDLSTLPVPNGIAAGNITVATNTISATNLNGGISLAGNGTGGVYVTSGNFGVGTTSPLAKLSVAGNTYLGGTLTATGTVTFSSLGDGFVKSTGGVLGIAVPGVDYLDDTSGDWTGTFDGQEGSYYLANSFSTTSANYWETQQTARTADDLTNNSIEDLSDVASMTKSFGNLLSWSGSAWNNIATSTLGIAFADITGTVSQNQGGTGMTSYSPGDILYADNAGALTPLPKGANGQVLKLSGGLPSWGSDITTGGGGGEGAWATTTDSLAIYTTDTSDAVIIGSSATTTANSIFEVFGTSYFSNTIGIATTSPSPLHKLAVQGNALFSGNITSANITATGTVTFSGLGSGLVKATSGVLSLATAGADYVADVTGDWTGTFDGQEGSYYLANSFSTTSAAYWKSQTDFFSTTSTNAWLATKSTSNLAEGTNLYYTNARVLTYLDTFDKGYFFSTTSAAYWKEQNNFFSTTSTNAWLATKSTSDLAEGTNLYWTTARFDNRLSATTTLPNLTTLANLATVGTITSGTWQGTAVADAYVSDALSISGGTINNTPIGATSPSTAIFTNATTTNATTSNLYASSAITLGSDRVTDFTGTGLQLSGGALTLNATGDWTGTFDGQEGSYYLANSFSTTSASYFLSQNQEEAFSTTSTNYWFSTKTTDNLAEGATNQYWTLNRFAAALAGTTTSALAEGTNLYYTDARARAALSESVTGLTYNNSTGVLTLTSGYDIPLAASTTAWNTFYSTPSARITAGTNLSWAGNTLNGPSDSYIRGLFSAGSGLSYNSTSGAFSLDATGDWTGTFDGQEGSYYLANSFSTTSANVWLATKSTSDLAEGTNLYWTTARFDNRLSATTTLPNLTTLANLATVGTITSGTWQGSAIAPAYLDSSVILSTEIDTYNELNTLVSDVTLTHNALIDTSAELAGILTDETGTSGGFVRSGSPTFSGTVSLVDFTATNGTTTNATSTNLYVSGQTRIASITGLVKATAGVLSAASAGTDFENPLTFSYPLVRSTNTVSLAFGTTTANSWSALQQFNAGASTTQLTTTGSTYLATTGGNVGIGTTSPLAKLSVAGAAYIGGNLTATGTAAISGLATLSSGLSVNGDTITDFTGTGLQLSGGALTLNATGDWTGTFDGQEGSYYLANSFSTTSANVWLGTKSTSNLAEGSNLYYTDARVGSYITSSTTLPAFLNYWTKSGSNLSYTAGSVGIGASTPAAELHVHDAAGSTAEVLIGNSITGALATDGFRIRQQNSDTSLTNLESGYLSFGTSGSERVRIDSSGNVGIGTTTPTSVAGLETVLNIYSSGSNNPGINLTAGAEDFEITNISGGLWFVDDNSTKMVIQNSTGYVGIGTSSPSRTLTVAANSSNTGYLNIDGGSTGSPARRAVLELSSGDTGRALGVITKSAGSEGWFYGQGYSMSSSFSIGYGTSQAEYEAQSKFLITTAGDVGIGTTSPLAKLSVAGAAYIGGNLTATGTAAISGLATLSSGLSVNGDTITDFTGTNLEVSSGALRLSSTYTGQTSITTLGTITSGTWQGSAINPTYLDSSVIVSTEIDTSAELATILTNETGTGSVVFSASPTFTGTANFASLITTNATTTNATSTNLYVSGQTRIASLSGPLQAVAGVVSATSTMSVAYGGTGLSTAPSYGQLLVGNGTGYTLMSTSSLNIAASSFTGTLGIENGGTNATSQTTNGVTYFDGTSITSGSNLTTDGASLTASGYVISGTQFQAPIGSAGTPSYSWGLDSTTGIFNAGGNAIGFSLGGTEGMRLDASGNLGIGTESPDVRLQVESSAAAANIDVFQLTNTDTTNGAGVGMEFFSGNAQFAYIRGTRMDSSDGRLILGVRDDGAESDLFTLYNGYVGIGTTSPRSNLDIVGTSSSLVSQYIQNLNSTAVTRQYLMNDTGSGGQISVYGSTYTGSTYAQPNRFVIRSESALTNGLALVAGSGDINLYNGTSANMTVSSAGNVGIGTTTPSSKLDVQTSTGSGLARFKDTDSTYDGIVLSADTNGGYVGNSDIDTAVGESIYFQNSANAMRFFTNSSEKMRIASDGNVGIGATNPTSKLTVIKDGTYNSEGNIGIRIMSTESTADVALHMGADATNDIGFIQAMQPGVAWTRSLVLQGNGGNVGIGTTSPFTKLSVAGAAYIGGNLTATGTLTVSGALTASSVATSTIGGNSYGPDGIALGSSDRIYSPDNFTLYDTTSGMARFLFSSHNYYNTRTSGTHVFQVNSSQVAMIDTNGRLGLADTSPDYRAEITSTSGSGYFGITNSTDGDILTVNSSGNVGIGTSTPTGKFHVLTGSTNNDMQIAFAEDAGNQQSILFSEATVGYAPMFSIQHDGSGANPSNLLKIRTDGGTGDGVIDTDVMTFTQAGNVGIGTANPTYLLQLAATNPELTLVAGSGGASTINLYGNNGTERGELIMNDGGRFDISNNAITAISIDTEGEVGIGTLTPSAALHVNDATDITPDVAGSGQLMVTGNGYTGFVALDATAMYLGSNSSSRRLDFMTDETTRMAITGSGNVGIGTTSPGSLLSVFKSTGGSTSGLSVGSAQGMANIWGGSSTGVVFDVTSGALDSTTGTDLFFRTGGTNSMTIEASGEVGIGDTTPSEKLEIDGNIKLQSNDYIAMLTNPSSGNGGYVQGTGEAGSTAGYGAWLNYNAVWDGTNWTQPRGDLGTYMFTSNQHLGWSWRYAAANGVDGATITPAEVAEITSTGAATFASLTLTTDLTVANGGTGASSFTNGGVLLGSGTGAITAMAVLANGSIIVGDGATDPVALAAFTSSTGTLKHEYGGLEANVSGYTNGLYGMVSGVTTDIDTYSELNTVISDVTLTHNGLIDTSAELAAIVTNETGSGSLVFGTSPSLTTPTIAGANISGTLTTTGATTIGDGGDTVTINTSSWDISSAGAATGFTDITASGTVSADALNLTDTMYTLKDGVRIFENVASYYAGSTPTTGTIAVEIDSTPNIMIEAEIVIQGYNGITRCTVRGYTFTSGAGWHQPAATCIGNGTSDKQSVRFATSADGDRVILIGDTSSNWGSYPHVTVPRVTYGYPGSGSNIGTWSISVLTSEAGYTSIATVNENTGFTAYNSTLNGTVTLSGLSNGLVKSTSGLLSAATLGTDYINNSSIDTSAELAAILTNETGTGSAVFSASPTFTGTADFANIDASGTIAAGTHVTLDSGVGNGFRFWGSDTYKIAMGVGAEYQYGGVADYSIKMSMNADTDRGFTWGVTGSAPTAALTTAGHMQIAGNMTALGQFIGNASDGVATPSFTWSGDTNTGMYRVADGNIGFATNGTVRWHIDATDMVYTVPARGGVGSVSAPAFSFSADTNMGMYRVTTDTLGFSTAGVARMSINASGQVSVSTATNVADAFTVDNSSASSVFAVSTLNTAASIFSVATSTGTSYFDVTATGNVGIGSTSPRSTLTVVGSACFSGGTGSTALCGTTAGSIYYRTASTGTYDVAENYVTSDLNLEPSTIVALDTTTGMTITTAMPGSIPLGIVSSDPGLTLGGADPEADMSVMRPVALSGRVPVKVSTANGPIMVGDRLMLSTTTPGVAVKALRSGYTVGIALESYSGSGNGTVEAFVENQYYLAPTDIYFDGATGRIGMGTQTPGHALQVAGDIGATGFVNTSTKAAKTDITYVTDEEAATMLEKLKNLQIAQYHYKMESGSNPLRLGLIAEQAPTEVLSADGKGVDIYKLATFTLAGVQELAKRTDLIVTRLDSLEERLVQLESGSITVGTGTPSFSTTTLVAALKSFGVIIENGFAKFQTLAALKFVAATDENGQSSAGEGEILAGNTVIEIENEFAAPNSKIFVTFTSALEGSWFIDDKEEGSFRVRLSEAQDEDVTFDYFIVQTDKEIEEEPEEVPVVEEEPVIEEPPATTPQDPTPAPDAPPVVVDTNPAPEPTPTPEPVADEPVVVDTAPEPQPAPAPEPQPAPEPAPVPSPEPAAPAGV